MALCVCGCDLATLYLAAVPLSPVPEHCRTLESVGSASLNLLFCVYRREKILLMQLNNSNSNRA